MSKKKKVNPYRLPVSMGDVLKSIDKSVERIQFAAIYSLWEVGGDAALTKRFEDKLSRTLEELKKSGNGKGYGGRDAGRVRRIPQRAG